MNGSIPSNISFDTGSCAASMSLRHNPSLASAHNSLGSNGYLSEGQSMTLTRDSLNTRDLQSFRDQYNLEHNRNFKRKGDVFNNSSSSDDGTTQERSKSKVLHHSHNHSHSQNHTVSTDSMINNNRHCSSISDSIQLTSSSGSLTNSGGGESGSGSSHGSDEEQHLRSTGSHQMCHVSSNHSVNSMDESAHSGNDESSSGS
jgi:hypothetical protein